MPARKNQTGLLAKMAKHPLVFLIVALLSLMAFIFMFVLHSVDQKERELVYAINPIKTQVVTMGEVTGLEIIHDGVALGDTDITAVQIAIWNSGDLSIRSDNVLREIVICTDPPVQILEVSIVKSYREYDVTEFRTLDTAETLENGRVPVTWRILERNDGASIQLIYLGSSDVDIHVDGLIEESGEVRRVESGVTIESPTEQFESEQNERWFLVAFMGVTIIFFVVFFARETIKYLKRGAPEKVKRWNIGAGIFLLLYCGFGAFAIYYLIIRSSGPPFGF
ncbi:hypothetical protein ES703_60974 [subsurface metagenome]